MTITRYNPITLNRHFPEEMKQFFDKIFDHGDDEQSNVVTAQWTPRVDIVEQAKQFVIHCDIPGVEPKDIEIHMEKGVLSIKGERKVENKTEDAKFTRVERMHGVFHRRFALPDSADPDGISASGKHGVLEVVIPKRAETTPRRIEIRA
ncbi:heat-shock protein [Ahniella affigens]|uniref:Heat-shock protein n=1 Tax=Ahniella affigens TaxID=2021234 RepID=A0A2P1PP92_9GAMM|nr:Hsp20/alpha crystallin family protein [Ahniella affigens]AVP96660.1 heat-shock protein [Ahniella affigens]